MQRKWEFVPLVDHKWGLNYEPFMEGVHKHHPEAAIIPAGNNQTIPADELQTLIELLSIYYT